MPLGVVSKLELATGVAVLVGPKGVGVGVRLRPQAAAKSAAAPPANPPKKRRRLTAGALGVS
jgi:hypothetical protein